MSTPKALSKASLVSTVQDSELTGENLSLEVGDVSFVYGRFGNEQTAAPPLVMLQYFRGNLDSWDPALVDRLAQDREVILLDNRGVGGSTGVVPETVTAMARDALAFIDALRLELIDLFGFSLGGYVRKSSCSCARDSSVASCSPARHRRAARTYNAGARTCARSRHPMSPPPKISSACSSPAPSKVAPRAWSR
jgi:predicted alpha/beta-fold hydrolase